MPKRASAYRCFKDLFLIFSGLVKLCNALMNVPRTRLREDRWKFDDRARVRTPRASLVNRSMRNRFLEGKFQG